MDKAAVKAFFDACAPTWDEHQVCDGAVVERIFDKAGVRSGARVLDVACGTGVLFPYYLSLGAVVTAIDLSPEMVAVARTKFPDIEIHCGDAEDFPFEERFDVVMVYNAWPHFADPTSMIAHLADLLVKGGVLSIAHGMSRAALTRHHHGAAGTVSLPLPEGKLLAEMMEPWFASLVIQDDERMYQVVGIRK